MAESTSFVFPPDLQPVITELTPLCRALAAGRYAVSVGGSYGKRIFDHRSDLDFRLFSDDVLSNPDARDAAQAQLDAAIARWAERDIIIDGCWIRTVADIDAQLAPWLEGRPQTKDIVWTIWGYHILADIGNQAIIEDPYDIIADWQARMTPYPPQLKAALLENHLESVRYWRGDYHYANKVERGDVVFLVGLTSKLIHELIRILFALNETYYVGDGNNLDFVSSFDIAPANFADRVTAVLTAGAGPEALAAQRAALIQLIDEVEALAEVATGN